MAAAMVAMAIASYPYSRILFAVELTAAGLCSLATVVSGLIYRQNVASTVRAAGNLLAAGEEEALH